LREKVVKTAHDSCIGGHAGIQSSYKRLKAMFYWPLMKKMVKQLVKECDIYNQAKIKRVVYPKLLQPLPNLVEFEETLQ
jgi:hypothetical protein